MGVSTTRSCAAVRAAVSMATTQKTNIAALGCTGYEAFRGHSHSSSRGAPARHVDLSANSVMMLPVWLQAQLRFSSGADLLKLRGCHVAADHVHM